MSELLVPNKTFVHLHNHSEHSLLDGISRPAEMAARAKELGMPAIALTDHGRMSGLVEFYGACKKEGIKPILGMEAYMTPMGHDRSERVNYDVKDMRGKPGHDRMNYHCNIWAKDLTGYYNLCRLSTASWAEGYYYKPRIDFELLCEHKQGLIVSSACILGMINHYLYCNDYARARECALRFQDEFGDDFYMEIMNHELDMEKKIMPDIRRLAKEIGVKVIATNDAHFVRKEDHKLQKTMMMLGMHKSWSDPEIAGFYYDTDERTQKSIEGGEDKDADPIFEMPPHLYLKDYDEMMEVLLYGGGEDGVAEQELANTLEIAEKCDCVLPIIDPEDMSAYHTPVYPFESDSQYPDFLASDFHPRQASIDAILAELHEDGRDGNNLREMLSDHEWQSVNFLLWTCERGLEDRVRPKLEAKGEPLPTEYWCENPPAGLKVEHAHNSPDELWIKQLISEGKSVEDILDMYRERLDYEVAVVVRKGFLDYFSVVSGYTRWTKEQGSLVGAGRGSGAGALLNYLLDITSIDPLPNGLIFERFLSPRRKGYPDIDLDFAKDWRDNSLKPYLRELYGEDCAAAVSTYMYLWGKAAIRAAARVLFNPPESIDIADQLCDTLDDKPKLDLHAELDGSNPAFEALANSSTKHRQIVDLALEMQGRISGESIHASAFILSPFPILDQMPLVVTKDERKRAQDTGEPIREYTISLDHGSVQDQLGFVKLDLLCLKDLEVMAMVCNTVERVYGCKLDLEKLPLDDKAVFDLVLAGNNSGVFQFDGSPVALRILQESGADRIADWSAVNALNRPGPLQMGYDKEFIQGKKDPSKVTYFAPAAESQLKETYGCIAYQEQIMLLSQDPTIVGFDGSQADNLRKATAKKKADKVEAICNEAREVAKKNNTDPKVTEYFLEAAKASGSYSFNKSHSLAYAVVAYRGAFLKAHFPDCFLAAMCTLKPQMKKTNKVPAYLEEARQLGVTIKPPHVNYSMESFDVPEKGVIAFGLEGIKRVGKGAAPVIAEREKNGPYKDFTDFCTRVPKEVGKAPIEALIKAGACDGLGWSRMAMEESIDQIIEFRKRYFKEKEKKDLFADDLFGFGSDDSDSSDSAASITLVAPFDTEYSELVLMRKERDEFGMYFDKDPRDFCQVSRFMLERELQKEQKERLAKGDYEFPRFVNVNEIADLPDRTHVGFVANVEDLREFNTKKGARMASMYVWDNGTNEESRFGFAPTKAKIKCTIFSRVLENITKPLPDDVVYVTGRVSVDAEGNWPTAVLVDSVDIVTPDSQWLGSGASVEKMQEFAQAQAEMQAYNAEVGDPTSSRYMIPAVEFRSVDDMNDFTGDLRINKLYLREGNVQVSAIDDPNGEKTKILHLKQTMGMVKLAAEYGGIAKKIRHPKAQRALDRKAMMEGTTAAALADKAAK